MMNTSDKQAEQRIESLPGDPAPSRGRVRSLVQVVLLAGAMFAVLAGVAWWNSGSFDLALPWLQGERVLFEPTQVVFDHASPGTVAERMIRVVNLSSHPVRLLV